MISIHTTGGSIDKFYSPHVSTFVVGEPRIDALIHEADPAWEYRILPTCAKDSLELTDDDRAALRAAVAADSAERIVITHGTDTMACTAEALRGIQGKTIVLTGALRPAVCMDSDARFNTGFACCAVQLLPPGVYIAMNGRVFPAGQVRKDMDTMRFVAEG